MYKSFDFLEYSTTRALNLLLLDWVFFLYVFCFCFVFICCFLVGWGGGGCGYYYFLFYFLNFKTFNWSFLVSCRVGRVAVVVFGDFFLFSLFSFFQIAR